MSLFTDNMEDEEILSTVRDDNMVGDDFDIADENTSDTVIGDDDVPENENANGSKTLRKSTRLATKPRVRDKLQAMGLVRGERLWKESEKRQFLDACKTYGTKDVDMIAAGVPSKTYDVVKALIQKEKKNQNYTIETRYIESGGHSLVIDDGEGPRGRGRPKGSGKTRIDLPDATPQGQIVEVEKRRKRNAPIEKWIDSAESNLNEDLKRAGAEYRHVVDYSPVLPQMLEV